MTTTNKILIGVGGVTLLGVGIYLVARKPKTTTTTTTTITDVNSTQQDPTSNTVDSLGTTLGNVFIDIWSVVKKNKGETPTGCVYDGPIDPYEAEVDKTMSSTDVKTLQTTLSACNTDIAEVITKSGGVDGILGPGTKTAYNMARKSCCINAPTS